MDPLCRKSFPLLFQYRPLWTGQSISPAKEETSCFSLGLKGRFSRLQLRSVALSWGAAFQMCFLCSSSHGLAKALCWFSALHSSKHWSELSLFLPAGTCAAGYLPGTLLLSPQWAQSLVLKMQRVLLFLPAEACMWLYWKIRVVLWSPASRAFQIAPHRFCLSSFLHCTQSIWHLSLACWGMEIIVNIF